MNLETVTAAGQRRNAAILPVILLSIVEGSAALIGSLLVHSEPGSAVWLGLSLPRLVVDALMAFGIVFLGALAWTTWRRQSAWHRGLEGIIGWLTAAPGRVFAAFTLAFAGFLALLAVLLVCISPAASEITQLKTIYSRFGLPLAWACLLWLQFGLLLVSHARTRGLMAQYASMPLRAGMLLGIATGIYVVALRVYLAATWDLRFRGLEGYIFLPALVLLAWGMIQHFLGSRQSGAVIRQVMMLVFIGVMVYTVYWHTAQYFKYETTRGTATWHLLAQSFLQGKLYLEHPATYHDMTPYKGHWYVPSPPLPALILMPLVAILGIDHINMVQFAILCGALNAVVVYAILSQASARKMIPTSVSGNLWLTGLLAFGTAHGWLAVVGIFWYLSQLLTLLFAALAVLLALKKASPWWIGACLGVAILSRPNVFTLWPLLAGITLYLEQTAGAVERAGAEEHAGAVGLAGAIPWKRMLAWAVKTAAPVAVCVMALLLYNDLRFENFLDFGYVTVNSSSWIMDAVRQYGMFNIHFLPINLKMMFLKMPLVGLQHGRLYYSPGFEGTSILAMTPAMIYLFRRWRLNAWTAGAWVSILLTAGLLLFYHNTGAWQLGYRYLMDFILPALLLMALGVGQRTSRIFAALALLSVLINGAGIAWWFANA